MSNVIEATISHIVDHTETTVARVAVVHTAYANYYTAGLAERATRARNCALRAARMAATAAATNDDSMGDAALDLAYDALEVSEEMRHRVAGIHMSPTFNRVR